MLFHLLTILVVLTLGIAQGNSFSLPNKRSTAYPYAPYTTSCPDKSLVRQAKSLNHLEKSYVKHRSKEASRALRQWLGQAWGSTHGVPKHLPTIAIALSGGGPKAGLITAGAVYGLDARENSSSSVKGLFQSATYISALSGGSFTLSGMIANDLALISTLKSEFYDTAYQNLFGVALNHDSTLVADIDSKTAAGYPTTLVDKYGVTTSYNFIGLPPDGGNGLLWSNVTLQPSFQDHQAPYPIIVITTADVAANMCEPAQPIWEVAPAEFGSWDAAVGAFYPTKYLGTMDANASGKCTVGFDNVGFLTGTSANALVPGTVNCTTGNFTMSSLGELADLVQISFPAGDALINPYGIIPNPFYQAAKVGAVREQKNLYGTDGGDGGQAIPIFPWLQPERDIDVLLVVDAETHAPFNISNGTAIYNTYASAQANGLSKMPVIPTPEQYASQNLSSRAQFFGCHDANVRTLIYLPSNQDSDISNTYYFFLPSQINDTFQGGIDMVTQGNDTKWPACLACGIMHKSHKQLPDVCSDCLNTYCWTS